MKKEKIIIWVVTLVMELGLILMVCGLNGVFTTSISPQDTVKYVCDGFFASGILLLCFGGLMWTSKMGTFDGLGYTVQHWKESLFRNKRDWHPSEDYYDYAAKQKEKKKKKTFNEMLIIGGASVVIAIILFIVYKCAF